MPEKDQSGRQKPGSAECAVGSRSIGIDEGEMKGILNEESDTWRLCTSSMRISANPGTAEHSVRLHLHSAELSRRAPCMNTRKTIGIRYKRRLFNKISHSKQ